MTLFLQILRVVCGLAAVGSGVMFLCFTVQDVRLRSLRPWIGYQDALLVLLGAALIGSGIFNFMAVWS